MVLCVFVSFCFTWPYPLVNNSLGSPWRQRLCILLCVCSVSASPVLSETTGLTNQAETALKDIKLLQVTWIQVAGRRTILLASPHKGKLQDSVTFHSTLEFNKAEMFDWRITPSIEEMSSSGTHTSLDAEEPDHEIWHHWKGQSSLFTEFIFRDAFLPWDCSLFNLSLHVQEVWHTEQRNCSCASKSFWKKNDNQIPKSLDTLGCGETTAKERRHLGRSHADMIWDHLVEWAEQAVAQKSKTLLVSMVITALENRLVLLWQLVGTMQLLTKIHSPLHGACNRGVPAPALQTIAIPSPSLLADAVA